jgi:hypothetical protein
MTNSATKPLFTPADANKVLPLVRSIVTDVVTEFARMRDAGRERRALEVESQAAGGGRATGDRAGGDRAADRAAASGSVATAESATKTLIERLKSEVNERSVRIDGYLKELSDLGVEVKDLERGLVDFPAERAGRPVYLCWELGETLVTHWRGVDEPYEKRRPVGDARPAAEIRLRSPQEDRPA